MITSYHTRVLNALCVMLNITLKLPTNKVDQIGVSPGKCAHVVPIWAMDNDNI